MKPRRFLKAIIVLLSAILLTAPPAAATSTLELIGSDCDDCSGVSSDTSRCGNVYGGSVKSFNVPVGALAVLVATRFGVPLDAATTMAASMIQLSVKIADPLSYSIEPGDCGEDCCGGDQPRLEIKPVIVRTARLYQGTVLTALPSLELTLRSDQPVVLDWREEEEDAGILSEDSMEEVGHIVVIDDRTIEGSTSYALALAKHGVKVEIPFAWDKAYADELAEWINPPEGASPDVAEAMMVNPTYTACECQCVSQSLLEDASFTIPDDRAPAAPEFYFPEEVVVPVGGGRVSAEFSVGGEGRYYIWAKPFSLQSCDDCFEDSLDPLTGAYSVEVVDAQRLRQENPMILQTAKTLSVTIYDLRVPFADLRLDEDGKPEVGMYYRSDTKYVQFRFVPSGGDIHASAESLELDTQALAEAGCRIHIKLTAYADEDNDSRFFKAKVESIPPGWNQVGSISEGIPFMRQEDDVWYVEVAFDWYGGLCSGRADVAPRGTHKLTFTVYESVDPPDGYEGSSDFRIGRQYMSSPQLVAGQVTITNLPPVARHDHADNIGSTGHILSTVTVDVIDNDEDPEGDALTARLNSQPAHGTVRLSDNPGVFVYTPSEGFYGTDTFTYYAMDSSSQSTNTATVTVTVHPGAVNQAPILYVESPERVSCPGSPSDAQDCYRIELTAADPDFFHEFFNEILTVSASFSRSSRGEYWLQGFGESSWADGIAEVTSDELARGAIVVKLDRGIAEHVLNLQAIDKNGLLDSVAVKLHTSSANPQVSFDGGETWLSFERGYYDGTLLSNQPYRFTMEPDWYEVGCLQFRDLDGDDLTFRITQHPTKGTVDLHPTRLGPGRYAVTVSYEVYRERMLECHRDRTPLVDVIEVTATDGQGGSAVAQMNINFEVVNTPPTCGDDSATTPAGVPVTIDVLANDSDPDEDVLTIVEVSIPAGGGATVVNDEIVYTPDPNVCGEDTFSYTVDDGYGGQATAWATVDVTDSTPPVARCQTGTIYLDENGSAVLDPASLDGGSTDNCSIATFDASEKTFNCGMLGDRPVLFTVYDGAGNSDSCWTTLSVLDEIDPVAVGQNITVQLDASGSVTVQAAQIENGSTDNCGVVTVLIDGADEKAFNCANLGPNTVTLTVKDSSGNEHSVDVEVTVEDSIAPVAQCQDLIASLDVNGEVTVAASSVDNGSTDNCGVVSMSLDRNFFTEADIGDQTVTLTVEDASGNTDSCTAVITVQDNMAPDIDCPADKYVQADTNRCYASGVDLGMPTATDNTEVDWTTLTNNAPSQFDVGTTAVKWSVSDIYGNVGSCFQQVTVVEPIDPTVSCPGDIDVDTGDPGGTTVTFSASATDNCDPSPELSFSPASGSIFPVGDTLVACTATDESGNTDTCTFTVSVNFQNSPPNAANDNASLAQGEGYVDIPVLNNDSDPEGHDLTITDVGDPQCGITTIIGDEIRYGTLGCASLPDEVTFTYEITDEHGATDTATVTVDLPGGAPLNNND